ncbi:MAG TPA: ATP-binding protein [Thermodesulfovibrionales bacterium]|jgi:anti-sigma regulatory factor (Ser/Thr protein kinase)|nr:ATP-binding protein [Thermodesulfovibrionales bacterium]
MEDLSLHILDIAENSVTAGADLVEIRVEEDTANDRLTLEIRDNGRGMDEETVKMVTDPFFSTKTVRRVGLGLPLLKQSAEECDGCFSITSGQGKGTTITARFRNSHIDRKPLGNIAATLTVLIAGNERIDFVLEYKKNDYTYRLSTAEIREDLGEIPINRPAVLKAIREDIERGIRSRQG